MLNFLFAQAARACRQHQLVGDVDSIEGEMYVAKCDVGNIVLSTRKWSAYPSRLIESKFLKRSYR